MEYLYICIILAIASPTIAYVENMPEEDMRAVDEMLLSRHKREVGDNFFVHNLPEIFAKLPKLDVVTIENKPYMFISTKDNKKQFRGYMADLMYAIARRIGVVVRFYEVPDQKYGTLNDDMWNGMIGEVVKREFQMNKTVDADEIGKYGADVAAAALTMTHIREQAVDFVKPFSHLGLTVLVKKPDLKNATEDWPFNFDIVKPLSASVWLSAFIAMIVVWLFVWMMNRYNPYENGERRRRNLATDDEANMFNVTGSFWFMFTILQWQGYDRSPRCLASKCMGCFWMVFVTLFIVIYIGSYINHLFWASTVHGMDPTKPPITDLKDLVMHKDGYTYGTINNSNTLRYLTNVAIGEEFTLIKNYLQDPDNDDKLVASFSEGVAKVRNNKYGLICESMMANYIVNTRPCDLTTVSSFGARSYGLALPRNAPLREQIEQIVLQMMEEGDLEALEKKWFTLKGECWNVSMITTLISKTSELFLNKPKRVNLQMFWSPLVIMIVGTVISITVAIIEILWYKYRGRYAASNRQRTQQLANEDDGHI